LNAAREEVMQRNPRLRQTVMARRRLKASEVPTVPTCAPNPEANQDEAVQTTSEQDAAEEAVRRLVEAAYT
jgi:hypothetical protein